MTPSEWDEGFRAGRTSVATKLEREVDGWRAVAEREKARAEKAEAFIAQILEVYRGPYRPLEE